MSELKPCLVCKGAEMLMRGVECPECGDRPWFAGCHEDLLRNLLAVIHGDGGQHASSAGLAQATDGAIAAWNRRAGQWVSIEKRIPKGWRVITIDASILASGRDPHGGWHKVTVRLTRSPAETRKWHVLARDVDPDDDPAEWAALPPLFVASGAASIEDALALAIAKAATIEPLPAPPEEPEP